MVSHTSINRINGGAIHHTATVARHDRSDGQTVRPPTSRIQLTVIVPWKNSTTGQDGSAYSNHGVHIIKTRSGQIVDIGANEDSQAVTEWLKLQAKGTRSNRARPVKA